MAEQIDFEGNQQPNTPPGGNADNNPNGGGAGNPAAQQDTTHLDGGGNPDITGKDNNPNNPNNKPANDNNNNGGEGNDNNEPLHDLEEGTEVDFDGVIYKVDKDGNLVDDKGVVFKEAKDVKKWLEDNKATDANDDNTISIDSIKEQFGVDVTGEDGKPIEFTNDAAGIKAYLDAVYELKTGEIAQGAINKLYSDNPLLKQFVDYVQIKGTAKGFGELPDRSGIELDKDNKNQQIAIIKMAAAEFGNKSLNDNYIKYLENTGSLYDEAKVQLEALKEKDKQTRDTISKQAEAVRKQQEEEAAAYFNEVNKTIKERRIGGYLLPETFVKEVNGQKITCKLDDFYDYVAKATQSDANGNKMTGYARDLDKLTDKEVLEKDLLDAWLMWTGGSYKDLVEMAIREEGVRRIIAKSKENHGQRRIKVIKPSQSGDKATIVYE